jgi:hypothetical protein
VRDYDGLHAQHMPLAPVSRAHRGGGRMSRHCTAGAASGRGARYTPATGRAPGHCDPGSGNTRRMDPHHGVFGPEISPHAGGGVSPQLSRGAVCRVAGPGRPRRRRSHRATERRAARRIGTTQPVLSEQWRGRE